MRAQLLLATLLPTMAAAQTHYAVGPSRSYTSPCALVRTVTLAPGDVIDVDAATYTDVCNLTASGTAAAPITLRGVPGPRPLFDATGTAVEGSSGLPRAIFEFNGGSYWYVSHLELEHAHNSSANGAAFRATGGAHDIVIDDVSVHDCQDGMMSDGVATVTVQNSDIYANGAGDGYSHNFYMQGDGTTLIGNHIHDSKGGQNVKLRSRYAVLEYNRIENAGNYEVDLIQGPLTSNANANALLLGNVVVRPVSSANNSQVILFGTDDGTAAARNGSLYVVNNTFLLQNASNHLLHANAPAAGSTIVFDNNIVLATVAGATLAADATTSSILSGSNNWIVNNVTLGGTLSATLQGTDPGFVSSTDFHLTAASPVVGQALAAPTYKDGSGVTRSAVPALEFVEPQGTEPRPVAGPLDMGAYAYSAPAPAPTDAGVSGFDGGSRDGGTWDGGTGPGTAAAQSCGCTSSQNALAFLPLLFLLRWALLGRLKNHPTQRSREMR